MLEKNRDAIKTRYGAIIDKIENCNNESSIKVENNKMFYDETEVDFNIEINSKLNSVDTIFVHGFGAGNMIKQLRKKYPKVFIVILENNFCVLQSVLSVFDLSDIILDEKIIVSLFNDDNATTAISSLIRSLEPRLRWGELVQFVTPGYDKIRFYKIRQMQDIIFKAISPILLNRNTLIGKSRQIVENAIRNLPSMIDGGYIEDFNDYFKDKPAVIVASGPSLNKNLHLLKDAVSKCVIIAADSVISTLKSIDIIPDFACGVDYQTVNVEKYKSVLKEKEKSSVKYVCSDGVYYSIPKLFQKSFFQYTPMSFISLYGDIIGESRKRQFSANAVTHMAIQLAYVIGANPIIFIGQDWAYSGGMEHATKASVEGELPKDVIWVKGNYENKVPTTPTLYSGLKLVEDMASILSKDGFEFINATEGGAYIEYTKLMTFKKAMNDYMKNDIDKTKLDRKKNVTYAPFIKRTREIKRDMGKIIKDSSKALRMAKSILKTWKNSKKEEMIQEDVGIINKINDDITFNNIFQSLISSFYFKEFFYFNKEEIDIEGQSVEERINQSVKYFGLIKTKSSSVKRYIDELYKYLILKRKYLENEEKFLRQLDKVIELIGLHFNFKDIYEGLDLVDKALEIYRENPVLYYWKAKLFSLNRFMHKDSLEWFGKSVELSPDFKKAKFDYEIEKKIVISHLILAKRALERGEFISAKKLVQRALEYEPDNKDVQHWFNVIEQIASSRRSAQRQKLLFKQLKMESEAFEEYERIMEFVKKEELDKAYEKLLYLYEKYGAFGDIPFLLGSIMIDKKNLEDAEKYLKEAVELIPFQPLVYVALGKLYLMKEDYFNAKENLEKAMSMNNKLVSEIADALGNLYYEFGEYEKAIKIFQEYLPYSDDKKKTVLKVALCYKELGLIEEYNILMNKLRELDSSN